MPALFNLIFKNKTNASIGGVTIDASVTEDHTFESTPTRNPVEDGAKVTDHVDLEPAKLTIQGVISDTPLDFEVLNQLVKGNFKEAGKGLLSGINNALGRSSRSVEQFQALLNLRDTREPFEVVTGLKVYKNMILTSLRVNRTATTGKAVHFTAELEEIRIVSSEVLGKEAFASKVKDIPNKTKNLGGKVVDPLDPNKDQKLTTGGSLWISNVKIVK